MFSKKLKKLMACFCAAACAVTVLSPASQTQAATNDLSWKDFKVENPFNGTSAMDFSKSSITTASTGTYSIPVVSTVAKISSTTPMTIYGSITPGTSQTYTITVSKNTSLFTRAFAVNIDQGSVYAELTSSNGSLITNASASQSAPTDTFSKSYISAGTYTLTVTSYSATGEFGIQMLGVDASKSGTIKAGTAYVGYNNNTTVYKKFTVSSNRLVAIQAYQPDNNYTYGEYVTVCNSKKKAVSSKSYTSSTDKYVKYYGLKKGTYYVKLSTSGLYCLSVINSTKGTIAATSKKKAKTIKSSYKNYIIPASTSKSSGYFKYTVKKSAKKTLSVQYSGDYSVRVTIYKGKIAVSSFVLYNNSGQSIKYKNSLTGKVVKWPKGTFTVKVQKLQKTDSGLIRIRMK